MQRCELWPALQQARVAGVAVLQHAFYVETNLHGVFKAATASEGKKMTDVLIEFIKEYIETHPAQPPKKMK